MSDPISIGLGEMVISRNPQDTLVAYGLGSCLAIAMVDPVRHVSGMFHAVLPERTNGAEPFSTKYVDSGIEGLLNAMLQAGADQTRIVLRMAGGANMLQSAAFVSPFDIGSRNIQAAHRTFDRLHLRLKNEQVGGTVGRTVRLYVGAGRMTVRIIGGKEEDL